MTKERPSVIQKAILIGVLGGAFELIMDMFGHSLSERQEIRLITISFGIVIVLALDDVYSVLKSILEEMRKR
jgi:hypothetical protein